MQVSCVVVVIVRLETEKLTLRHIISRIFLAISITNPAQLNLLLYLSKLQMNCSRSTKPSLGFQSSQADFNFILDKRQSIILWAVSGVPGYR